MTINFTNFFTQAGHFFHAGNTINIAVGTTIEDEVEDAIQGLGTPGIEFETVRQNVLGALQGFQGNGSALNSAAVRNPVQRLLIEMVHADNPQVDKSVSLAIDELIKQMIAESESLDASTPGCTPSYGGGNTGNGVVVISTKRPDGKVNEHILAEDIEGVVSSVLDTGGASIRFTGEEPVDALSHLWPAGSGASQQVSSHVAAGSSNRIPNGTLETTDANVAHLPDGWTASVGTLGTTIKMSSVEQQTVIIASDPTSGYYFLHHTDSGGKVETTASLPYNATESQVQTALRALEGLSQITVATTGDSPNYTHTVTFTGVKNPGELTSTNGFDTGTISHNTTVAASANVVRGARSLEIDSNGSTLDALNIPVLLSPKTQYAFCLWAKTDSAPAAGVVTVDLVDGIGGSVIADDAGVNNSFTIDATALTTSFAAKTGVFRTPSTLPANVYLRIRTTTAISNTSSVYYDEACLVEMTELYTGGLWASAFTGPTNWAVDDTVTLPATNDRAGALHEWMDRVFGLRASRKLIPTDTAGSETQADSLIT